jgi:hypothetical protein
MNVKLIIVRIRTNYLHYLFLLRSEIGFIIRFFLQVRGEVFKLNVLSFDEVQADAGFIEKSWLHDIFKV